MSAVNKRIVPTQITQVTPEWLRSVVLEDTVGATDVEVISLQPGKVKNGILSSVAFGRIRICYQNSDKETEEIKVFIKIQPENEELINIISAFGQDVTEIDAYKMTLQDLMKFETEKIGSHYFKGMIPRYVSGAYEQSTKPGEARGFYLVLEDVTPKFDVKDFNRGMTAAEISVCVDRLAKFHCLAYTFRKQKGFEWQEKYPSLSTFISMVDTRIQQYIESVTFPHLLKSLKGAEHEAKLTDMANKIEKVIGKKMKEIILKEDYKSFLVHGDFWVNNIMMTEDSNDVVIIDWQFFGVGSCFFDFGLIVFHSGEPKDTEDNLNHFVDVYYNTWKRVADKFQIDVPWTQDECRNLALKTGFYSALYYACLTADRLVMHPKIAPRFHWIMNKCLQYCPEYID